MNLESRVAKTQKNPEDLYNFLIDVENFKKLMPEDTKFELKGHDKFIFGLKGMPEIALELKDKTPNTQIVLSSTSDKLSFDLTCNMMGKEDGTEAQLLFEGDFNAMMAMMIKGPINKFLDQLINGLEQI
jgi:carbon monoxide dehydrogenase subunit G